jgi:hypothetical protein
VVAYDDGVGMRSLAERFSVSLGTVRTCLFESDGI